MLDQVVLLLPREAESEEPVVVVHDIPERRETSVVIDLGPMLGCEPSRVLL